MRYLITTNCMPPYFTNYFDPENDFLAYTEMVIYDLHYAKYSIDGRAWQAIHVKHINQ
jgi:hypothetical protein